MCGIAGFMGQVENRADVIRNMTEVITHRGPDSDGFFGGLVQLRIAKVNVN